MRQKTCVLYDKRVLFAVLELAFVDDRRREEQEQEQEQENFP
jgi:hypothetical protein